MTNNTTPIALLDKCPVCKKKVPSKVHCMHCNTHMEPEFWYKNQQAKPAPSGFSAPCGYDGPEGCVYCGREESCEFKATPALEPRKMGSCRCDPEGASELCGNLGVGDCFAVAHFRAAVRALEEELGEKTRQLMSWHDLSEDFNKLNRQVYVLRAEVERLKFFAEFNPTSLTQAGDEISDLRAANAKLTEELARVKECALSWKPPSRQKVGGRGMNWKCIFWLHDWRKWSRPIETHGGYRAQWRECATCGRAQTRRIWWAFYAAIAAVNYALNSVLANDKEAHDE